MTRPSESANVETIRTAVQVLECISLNDVNYGHQNRLLVIFDSLQERLHPAWCSLQKKGGKLWMVFFCAFAFTCVWFHLAMRIEDDDYVTGGFLDTGESCSDQAMAFL